MKHQFRFLFFLFLLLSHSFTHLLKVQILKRNLRTKEAKFLTRAKCIESGRFCGNKNPNPCCPGSICDNLKKVVSGLCISCNPFQQCDPKADDACCPDEICMPCPKDLKKYKCRKCDLPGAPCNPNDLKTNCCYICDYQTKKCIGRKEEEPSCANKGDSCKKISCCANLNLKCGENFICDVEKNPCKTNDETCSSTKDCCENFKCNDLGKCEPEKGCKTAPEKCKLSTECCENYFCNSSNKCDKCKPLESDCILDLECCSPNKCFVSSSGGKKCLLNAAPCSDENGKCTEGEGISCCPNRNLVCHQGQCVKCKDSGVQCSTQEECCEDLYCVDLNNTGKKACQSLFPKTKCKEKHESCNSIKDCCKVFPPLICRSTGKCDDCVENEGESCDERNCCDGMACLRNHLGVGKFCYSKPPCISTGGVCLSKGECCNKDAECRGVCTTCSSEGGFCTSDSNCCGMKCFKSDKDGLTGVCGYNQLCIKVNGACKEGVLDCCTEENLLCDNGYCIPCKIPNAECSKYDTCCQGKVCKWHKNGAIKICQDPNVDDCISIGGLCSKTSQKCCDQFFCASDGKCKDCVPGGEECDANGRKCCGKFGCHINNFTKKYICRDGPHCSAEFGSCNTVSDCCDKSHQCRQGKCLSCIEIDSNCDNDEDCCSGSCYYNSNGKKACTANKNCKVDNEACNLIGDIPSCCSGYKCIGMLCKKCYENDKHCNSTSDCCSKGVTCNWNAKGTDTVCNNSNCIHLNGNCEPSNSLIEKKCCEPGGCHDGKICSICKEFGEECAIDSNCCSAYKCLYSANGKKKCLVDEQCVKEEPLLCETEREKPACCEGMRCDNHQCKKCLARGETCLDSEQCCTKFCGNESMGNGKICKDYVSDDCISIGGVCNNETQICCKNEHLTCYLGTCRESCFPDDRLCRHHAECCSKSCVFNSNGNQICGKKNECVKFENKPCNIHNGLPECCSEMKLKCISQMCRFCKNQTEPCAVDSDCCEGNCFWNILGLRLECNNRHCMGENEPCDKNLGDKRPPRKCCVGICYDEKCRECVNDNIPCDETTKCCSGFCGFDAFGTKKCLRNKTECTSNVKGFCTPEGNPPCCNDKGLYCVNGVCENCLPENAFCDSPSKCCNQNCVWDSKGEQKVCRADKRNCIDLKGSCSDLIPNKSCCDNQTCYKNFCVEKCIKDSQPCKSDLKCCSGSCVINSFGQEICGVSNTCVSLNYPCEDPKIIPTTQKKCCPPYNCKEGNCKVCKHSKSPCNKNEECCSNVCSWDENGLQLLCFEKDSSPCVNLGQNCRNIPNFPEKKCCNGATCYFGNCVSACTLDGQICNENPECCSKVCAYDQVLKKKVCTQNSLCALTGEDCEVINKQPICCPGLTCFQSHCLNCVLNDSQCRKDQDCCEGNCYWDDQGATLICRRDKLKCVGLDIACGRDDPELPAKECCAENGLKCYNKFCRKCELYDGQECTKDDACCSKKCVVNPQGKFICGKKNTCIEQEGVACNQTGSGPKECCEAKNFYCIENFCRLCKKQSDPCSFNKECCSGNCGWDGMGKFRICVEKQVCIETDGNCDMKAVPSSTPTRECCTGSCFEGKCSLCVANDQPCKVNTECCSKICVVTKDGLQKCGQSISCATQNEKCDLLDNDPKCCFGLSCNANVCTTCKAEGQACSNHLECCNLHCHFDIKFNIYKCMKTEGEDEKCASVGKSCLSNENCCENLLCVGKVCDKNCVQLNNNCSNSPCCVGLECVDNKCVQLCAKISEKCDESNPCCYGLSCSSDGMCTDPYTCLEKDMACTKNSECCLGLNCDISKKTCQFTNQKCRNDGSNCVITKECCEGFCFRGVCQKAIFPDCSHYKENCRNSKDCCFGLICENDICVLDDDKSGKCTKYGGPCDLESGCCPGLDCVLGKCGRLPKCKKEGELCSVGECCGFLGCFFDDYGVDLKCSKTKKCIRGNGFCDKFERKCCEGFCHKENCRKNCLPQGEECCEASECCDKNDCFKGKCEPKKCMILGQSCSIDETKSDSDTCCKPHFVCNKETLKCEKSTCLVDSIEKSSFTFEKPDPEEITIKYDLMSRKYDNKLMRSSSDLQKRLKFEKITDNDLNFVRYAKSNDDTFFLKSKNSLGITD